MSPAFSIDITPVLDRSVVLTDGSVVSNGHEFFHILTVSASATSFICGCGSVVGNSDTHSLAKAVMRVVGFEVGVLALGIAGTVYYNIRQLDPRQSNEINRIVSLVSGSAALIGIGLSIYSEVEALTF
jgi:hypothetical protein